MVYLITLIAGIAVCDVACCDGALQRGCEAGARAVRDRCRQAARQLAGDGCFAAQGCRWE